MIIILLISLSSSSISISISISISVLIDDNSRPPHLLLAGEAETDDGALVTNGSAVVGRRKDRYASSFVLHTEAVGPDLVAPYQHL